MWKWRTTAALTLALAMTACVPSLQPLFTDKDIVFDPALEGIWAEKGGQEQWVFSSLSDKTGYIAINTKDGKSPASFVAHLTGLGGYRFLDLYPAEPAMGNDNYAFHFVPAHSIHRIWLEGDVLRTAMLNQDWLDSKIQQRELEISHTVVDGEMVLTAPTADLQRLVVKYAEDEGAFPGSGEWLRKK
jgi:hypothetical protein